MLRQEAAVLVGRHESPDGEKHLVGAGKIRGRLIHLAFEIEECLTLLLKDCPHTRVERQATQIGTPRDSYSG
jgi:hypothetical protein